MSIILLVIGSILIVQAYKKLRDAYQKKPEELENKNNLQVDSDIEKMKLFLNYAVWYFVIAGYNIGMIDQTIQSLKISGIFR